MKYISEIYAGASPAKMLRMPTYIHGSNLFLSQYEIYCLNLDNI